MICGYCGNTYVKNGRCPLCGHITDSREEKDDLISSKTVVYGRHFVYPSARPLPADDSPIEPGRHDACSRRVPRSLRYEVLARDRWTCQYCGRGAPQVILEVDHKVSWRDGGETTLENLVTSCRDCNRGKSSRSVID